LTIVLLSLVSVVFPALIITLVRDDDHGLDPFETGPLAPTLIISNSLLLIIGFLYYKKKFPETINKPIRYILNFEITGKIALIVGAILLSIYIGFSISELYLNEAAWADYEILEKALKIWPYGETDNVYVKEQTDRYVRMLLLSTSLNVFQNIKLLPFVASILLVITTYYITYQLSQKRFAGIISMVVLLQSFTFLQFDTIAVYENFWVLFYILSLYAVYKRWYLSPILYILSIFTKAFSLMFLPMSIFFIYRAKISKNKKIVSTIFYGLSIGAVIILFLVGKSVYGGLIRVDFSEFWIGFTAWSYQLRFDSLIILTILPLTVGLYLASRQGKTESDSILILISGVLLAGPVLSMITGFYYILPYRFVPLVVFFAIGVGIFLAKKNDNVIDKK
jgi:hypothetical protein